MQGRSGVFAGMQSFFGFHRDEGLHFQRNHPVLPQGYEEVLRSLGSRLDAQGAQGMLFTEMPTHIVLEYALPAYAYRDRPGSAPASAFLRHETYTRGELEELVATERQRAERALVGTAERLRLDPNDHRLYLEAGRMFHDEGNFAEAADLYRMVISLLPKNMEAYHRLAELSLERGQPHNSIEAMHRAIKIDPNNARNYGLLAMAYVRAKQIEPAKEALQQASRLDPSNRIYRTRLAQLIGPETGVLTLPRSRARDVEPETPRASAEARSRHKDPEPVTVQPEAAVTPVEESSDKAPGWEAHDTPSASDDLGWDSVAGATGDEPADSRARARALPESPEDELDPFDRAHITGDYSLTWSSPPPAVFPQTPRRSNETARRARPAPRAREITGKSAEESGVQPLTVSSVPEAEIEPAINQLRETIAAHPEQLELHRKLGFPAGQTGTYRGSRGGVPARAWRN